MHPYHHYPGYHHPAHRHWLYSGSGVSMRLRGQTAFTRLLSDTVTGPNYQTGQNWHFKRGLFKTVKIDHFPDFDRVWEPIFTILSFWLFLTVFGDFDRFWWFSCFSWFFGGFYRFGILRFSLGSCQKPGILCKFHEKPENSGFLAKMSPTNLTIWKVSFSSLFWLIFDNFDTFHKVWIGVLDHSVSPSCPCGR